MHLFLRASSSWMGLLLFFTAFSPHIVSATDDTQTSTRQNATETIKSDSPSDTQRSNSSSLSFSPTVSSPTRTNTAPPQTITVEVGKADHKFRPDVVAADIGDTVEFNFFPANHSVVRAEYKFPCIPIEKTDPSKHGFFSGFHPVDIILANPPKYSVLVNDTSPIFFYCSAPGSCIKYGMVGVVNPNASVSLGTQRDLALNSSYMLQPGEAFPPESSTTSSAASSSPSSVGSTHVGSKLSGGGIAGVILACVSVVLLAIMLFFFWGKIKGLRKEMNRKNSTVVRRTEPEDFDFAFYPWSEAPHLTPPPAHAEYPFAPPQWSPNSVSSRGQGTAGLGIHFAGNEDVGEESSPRSQTTAPYTTFHANRDRENEYVNDGSGTRPESPPLPPLPLLQPLPTPNQIPPFNMFPTQRHHPFQQTPPMTPPPSYFPSPSFTAPRSSSSYSNPKHYPNDNDNETTDTNTDAISSSLTRSHRSVGGIFDVSPHTGAYTRVVTSPITQAPYEHDDDNHPHSSQETGPDKGGDDHPARQNNTTTTTTSPWTPHSTASSPFPYDSVRWEHLPHSEDTEQADEWSGEKGSEAVFSAPPLNNRQTTVSPTDAVALGSGSGSLMKRERDLRKVAVENRARGWV